MSSTSSSLPDSLPTDWYCPYPGVRHEDRQPAADHILPARITRTASSQTYYTIRLLADRDRVLNAYRTYAYFRWVDDWIDEQLSNSSDRLAFVERQQSIMNRCYQGEAVAGLSAEEWMLVNLIRSDDQPDSGLQAYIRHMMAVMAFDAGRRGRLISQRELESYTENLATAVTEALLYFIGHDQSAPHSEARYCAVTGAHITHMLRDTFDDIAAGYYNIPREFLEAHHINPGDVNSEAYRAWVESRVHLARGCFEAGKRYLARVENRRCRLAGYAYVARFQVVLDTIEREDYRLRPAYPERKSLRGGLRLARALLTMLAAGAN